jgi:hypothetical protein
MPNCNQDPAPGTRGQENLEGARSFRVVTVMEAVEQAAAGQWDVPEFQRQFVLLRIQRIPERAMMLAGEIRLIGDVSRRK